MSKAIQKPVPKLPPAIFSELDQNLWWAYRNYAVDELTSIDTYLHEASKDLHLTSDIYENLKLLYKALGLHHHPFLNVPIKRTISPEVFASIQQAIATWEANSTKKGVPHTEKPEMPDCEYIEICNIKIDPVVLKLLVFCWGHSKISTLKLMRNQFELRIEEILADTLANPNFRLNKLFLDWNPPQNFANYLKILNNSNLQFLSLRSNELTDLDMESLSHALRENTSLKYLDLYGNRITGAGVQHLSNLSDSSCCLESVSLAKNSLGKWEDVQSWFDRIGKFALTSAEVEEYRHKEKEREAAIQKNQKNKGKKGYVEEPVIFLYPIVQSHDGNWFLSKSPKIKMLSLALNTFDETSLTHFDKFLSRQDEDFSLILSNNGFKHDDLDALQQTHCSKIIA